MSQPNIFAELNDVLSKPNLGRTDNPDVTGDDHALHINQPDPAAVKRIGYAAARLLHEAPKIGPLAAPTRSRDHRFRAELSQLFDPAIQGRLSAEARL